MTSLFCVYCGAPIDLSHGQYETEDGRPLCYECWDCVYMPAISGMLDKPWLRKGIVDASG